MKRFRAPGDPGEFGDWIVGVVELPTEDEAGLASSLREILAAVQDMQSFLRLPDGSQALHYTIRFSRDGELRELVHERDFWVNAVRFPSLRPMVVEYVERVNQGEDWENWQDEFHPRGSFAIAELALLDSSACSLLGELLFKWDMGHETYHEGLIDQLIEKHGLNAYTMDLLACRILADGQATEPQVASALYNHGFRASLDLTDFARRCATRVHRSVCPDLGLDHFAQIFAAGDESAHQAVWAAFHAAGIDETPDEFDSDESARRASYRTTKPMGHWNGDFLDPSVESFEVDALEPLS